MFKCHDCQKDTIPTTFGAYIGYISSKPVCKSCFEKEKKQSEKKMAPAIPCRKAKKQKGERL